MLRLPKNDDPDQHRDPLHLGQDCVRPGVDLDGLGQRGGADVLPVHA